MYRIGHGDCFLLAFPREGRGRPVHVLIDCGYKPGSPDFFDDGATIGEIVEHIGESTDHHLDLVIVTHEHQDHLNGVWRKKDPYFGDFEIEKVWLAWTEDPADDLANDLRRNHRDQLLGLIEARRQLALAVNDDNESVQRLDSLLAFELGGDTDTFDHLAMLGAASDPEKSVNKQGLKLFKDKAAQNKGVRYLNPGDIEKIPGAAKFRAFVLGPPRDEDLLEDEDPVGAEAFPRDSDTHGLTFSAAARAAGGGTKGVSAPFREQFRVLPGEAANHPFFQKHYEGDKDVAKVEDGTEVSPDASWRRIKDDWLFSAEDLALKLNTGINNTSLVLAFELPNSKKILFFPGDAQRGNWKSWDKCRDGNTTVTAKDLLARTVLYKVGHHGSHNATLAGKETDDYPNLSWMAAGAAAGEFTAMITAVNKWAMKQRPPWVHPLPSIEQALRKKTQGRIFRTDTAQPEQPADVSDAVWQRFLSRAKFEKLFFDYVVLDE